MDDTVAPIDALLAPGGRRVLDIVLAAASSPADDHDPLVVLIDESGRPSGTVPKRTVHGRSTPLHLAFSCYVVDDAGRVLLTRRSPAKRTWPATWTNACCGHPLPGETLRQAVARHLRHELDAQAIDLAVALPSFVYRATMGDGTMEHELCPVVIATVDDVALNAAEADAAEWVDWAALVTRARSEPDTLSPWSVAQITTLDVTIGHPARWLRESDDGVNTGSDAHRR